MGAVMPSRAMPTAGLPVIPAAIVTAARYVPRRLGWKPSGPYSLIPRCVFRTFFQASPAGEEQRVVVARRRAIRVDDGVEGVRPPALRPDREERRAPARRADRDSEGPPSSSRSGRRAGGRTPFDAVIYCTLSRGGARERHAVCSQPGSPGRTSCARTAGSSYTGPTGFHPSRLGTYLAAVTIAAGITGQPAVRHGAARRPGAHRGDPAARGGSCAPGAVDWPLAEFPIVLSNGPPPAEGAERPQRARGGRRGRRHAHPHRPRRLEPGGGRRAARGSSGRCSTRRRARAARLALARRRCRTCRRRARRRRRSGCSRGSWTASRVIRRSAPTRESTSRATRSAARTGSGRPGWSARTSG